MKRDDWSFEYEANELAKAAAEKADMHAGKKKWWEDKKAEVMQKIRESGIEVHDSVAASYSSTKGFQSPHIKIDGTLQDDLSETVNKISVHDRLLNEYQGWMQVLASNPKMRMDLDHDDWLYFFG